MPYADISSLVQMQLGDMADWNITEHYAVSGEGSTEYCYALGDKVVQGDDEGFLQGQYRQEYDPAGDQRRAVPTTSSSDSN